MSRRCGTCKHYAASLDKNGRRNNRAHSRCVWTAPIPIVPDSVARHGYGAWPPFRHFMDPASGTACPCWENYK